MPPVNREGRPVIGSITNWARNVTYRAERLYRPESLDELRHLVAGQRRIRALGTGHTFNRLSDSDVLVSLDRLPSTVDIAGATATVPAGVRYGELAQRLDAAGYALAALASLPHLCVAGAVATGTHGSGDRTASLSAAVSGLELVGPDGSLHTLTRDDPDFPGYVVGLGALGILTRLTLDLVPTFEVRQYVHDGVPYEQVDAVLASAYSVSAFTDWTGPRFTQVWRKCRTSDPAWEEGGTPADGPRHPVPGLPPGHATEQLGRPGPWYTRLPHFRPEAIPSSGAESQSEWLVARTDVAAALAALDRIRDRITPVVQIAEVRSVAADPLWLSPSYGRDSAAFHFTWVPDDDAVRPVVAAIEEALDPYAPRPHWGKVFGHRPETLAARYPRYADFRALRHRMDPDGTFGNDLLDEYFG